MRKNGDGESTQDYAFLSVFLKIFSNKIKMYETENLDFIKTDIRIVKKQFLQFYSEYMDDYGKKPNFSEFYEWFIEKHEAIGDKFSKMGYKTVYKILQQVNLGSGLLSNDVYDTKDIEKVPQEIDEKRENVKHVIQLVEMAIDDECTFFTERQKMILKCVFGIDGYAKVKNKRQLAGILEVSASTVSIHIRKLAKKMAEFKLKTGRV